MDNAPPGATYFGRPITRFSRPHPECEISQNVALAWYLDGVLTSMVGKGGRILDWYAHQVEQISDEIYMARISQTDEQYREFRDAHR